MLQQKKMMEDMKTLVADLSIENKLTALKMFDESFDVSQKGDAVKMFVESLAKTMLSDSAPAIKK